MPRVSRDAIEEETDERATNEATLEFFKGIKSRRVSPDEFGRLIDGAPKDAWGRIKIYCYRLYPVIDRKLSGSEHTNIEIIEVPGFNQDYILRKHGSGKYELKLNDQGRPEHQQQVCRTILELNDPDYPPVLDHSELVMGAEKNRSYIEGLRARGLLKSEGAAMNGQAQNEAGMLGLVRDLLRERQQSYPKESPESQAFTKALDVLTTGYKTALGNTQKDGDGGLAIVKEVLAVVEKKNGGTDPTMVLITTLITNMQTQQLEMQKQNNALMLKLTERQNPGNGETPATKGIIDRILEKALDRWDDGGGGTPGREKWFHVVPWPEAMQAFGGLLQTIQMGFLAKGTPRPVGSGTAPAINPNPPNPAPAIGAPAQQGQQEMTPEIAQMLDQFVNAFMNGRRGSDFAADLIQAIDTLQGGTGMMRIKPIALLGPDKLIGMLKAIPPAWQPLAPGEEKVHIFLSEFCAYVNDPENPKWDEEEKPEPPIPPAPQEQRRTRGRAKE